MQMIVLCLYRSLDSSEKVHPFAVFLGIISHYKKKKDVTSKQSNNAFSYPVILLLWARQTFSAVLV